MRTSLMSIAVIVAAVSPALAETKAEKAEKAKAKKLYDSGLKHYNLSEYPEAIKDWKESYSISKKPLLLFNIGQAYRLSGDCKMAGNFYDSYQREEPNPKNQDELDEAVAICAKEKAAADTPKPVDKSVDKPVDKPVVPVKTPVEGPKDNLKTGPEVGQAGGGGEDQVDQPESTATTTGGGLRKVGIGVAAVGVALGGAGIYFALKSGSTADELDNYEGPWGPTQMDIQDRGEKQARFGWILGGAGIAAIVAGGVMIAIGGPKTVESSSVSVVPTRGGAALGYSFSF